MKWEEVAALSRDTPVVIPIAALEQHGPHMPLFTDSLLCAEIVRRAAEKVGDRVLFTPLMWLGNSHHHMDFPGTLSAAPRTYLDILCGLMENLLAHGFKRLVLLNGHGGNIAPAQLALFEVRQKHRTRSDILLLAGAYWALGGKPYEVDARIHQRCMGHACEWETSMMLRLAPQLVGDYASVESVPIATGVFDPADRAWTTQELSVRGHVGDPKISTVQKGESLFRVFTDDVVRLLERMIAWDGHGWDK